MKIDPYSSPMMLMIIPDSKNGPKTRENSQIWWGWVKIGDKMEKCYFLKIPQWPNFEILGGHSHHQDTPKNQRARHGTFFFIWVTFSSHVSSGAQISCSGACCSSSRACISSSGQRLQSLEAPGALSFSRGLAFSPSGATTLPHIDYAWGGGQWRWKGQTHPWRSKNP